MSLVRPWGSSVPGVPQKSLVTLQEKVSLRDGIKGRAWSTGDSLGPAPSSPP